MFTKCHKLWIFSVVLLLGMSLCGIAYAGGGQAYPNGSEDFLVGAVPGPGFYGINYTYYYKATEMVDENGHNNHLLDSAEIKADVLRLIWISKAEILNGNYGMHLFLPFLDVDLDFEVPVGPKGKKHYSDSGMPYIIWSPFILSWHWFQGKLHGVCAVPDTYIPLGNEEDDNLASVGRNFFTFEPVLALTYMPTPSWDLSLKIMYDINTRQDDCPMPQGVSIDRDPGDEFHFDYSISYAVQPNLRIGVNGYFYQQVTTDKYHGLDKYPLPLKAALEDMENDLGRVFAVGPGIWYNHKRFSISMRSQVEMAAKGNRTEGYNLWLKLIYAF